MHWIKRLSLDEFQDAQRLSELHAADELLVLSGRQGLKDARFRHRYVPLSAFVPYLVIMANALGVPMTHDQVGVFALIGMFVTLVVVLVAREVWYRWCVIELAYRLRVAKDQPADETVGAPASERNIEDSPYSIPE